MSGGHSGDCLNIDLKYTFVVYELTKDCTLENSLLQNLFQRNTTRSILQEYTGESASLFLKCTYRKGAAYVIKQINLE